MNEENWNILAINIQGRFKERIEKILQKATNNNIHIIFLSEHMTTSQTTAELFNSKFKIISYGSELMTIAASHFAHTPMIINEQPWATTLKYQDKYVTGVYVKPSSKSGILEHLSKLSTLNNHLIIGDMNCEMRDNVTCHKTMGKGYYSTNQKLNISLPTRYQVSEERISTSWIDGGWTNIIPQLINMHVCNPDQRISGDHCAVRISILEAVPDPTQKQQWYRPKGTTGQKVVKKWLDTKPDPKTMDYETIVAILQRLSAKPYTQVTEQTETEQQITRANRRLKKALKQHNRHQNELQTPTPKEVVDEIAKEKGIIRALLKRKLKEHIDGAVDRVRNMHITNPSKFYQNVFYEERQQLTKVETRGGTSNEPDEVAEAIKEYMESQFEDVTKTPPPQTKHFKLNIFTTESVKALIKRAPKKKSPGPDGITNELIQCLPENYVERIAELFQQFLNTGKVPELWKESYTFLIHKKGPRTNLSNYRPIALLDTHYKIFITAINEYLQDQIQSNNSLHKSQQGFIRGGQTATHARFVLESILKAKKEDLELWQIYLDYNKAYDSITHDLLFQKLEKQGIHPAIIQVLTQIYSENYTTVLFATGKSPNIPIQKGLRQGCPLSPILFNLYINDLLTELNKIVIAKAFADDMFAQASSLKQLKKGIEYITEYNQTNRLTLNLAKNKTVISSNLPDDEALQALRYEQITIPYLSKNDAYPYLGYLTRMDGEIRENWIKANYATQSICSKLQKRCHTADQVVQLLNAIVYAKLRYLAQAIPIPLAEIKRIEKHICDVVKKKLGMKGPASLKDFQEPKKTRGLGLQSLRQIVFTEAMQYSTNGPPQYTEELWKQIKESTGLQMVPNPSTQSLTPQSFEPLVLPTKWTRKRAAAIRRGAEEQYEHTRQLIKYHEGIHSNEDRRKRELVWTDGSLQTENGTGIAALAWNRNDGTSFLIPQAHSSTEVELIAILIASGKTHVHILTDSLSSVQLIQGKAKPMKPMEAMVVKIRKQLREGASEISYIPAHLPSPDNPTYTEVSQKMGVARHILWHGNRLADQWSQAEQARWPVYREEDPPYILVDLKGKPHRYFKATMMEMENKRRGTREIIREMRQTAYNSISPDPLWENSSSKAQPMKAIAFKLARNRLPLHQRLHQQQAKHPNMFKITTTIPPTCPVCKKQEESVEHFLRCPRLPSMITTIREACHGLVNPEVFAGCRASDIMGGNLPISLISMGKNAIKQIQWNLVASLYHRWRRRCTYLRYKKLNIPGQ